MLNNVQKAIDLLKHPNFAVYMPRAIHKKWDRALRSGKYLQACGVLSAKLYHNGTYKTGYCCLGLLQKCVSGRVETKADAQDTQLPTPEWLQRHGIKFAAYIDDCGSSYASLNDDQHKNFAEIADYVAANVKYTD